MSRTTQRTPEITMHTPSEPVSPQAPAGAVSAPAVCSAMTEAWDMESLSITYKDEMWSIRCGGACQPEYSITAHTIEEAVSELVKQVTRDAVEDEAREWQNK